MTIEDTRQLLLKLAEAIFQVIQAGLNKGILKPEYERYFRWKLTDFKYDETGISKKSTDYLRASIVALMEKPSKASLIQKIDDSLLDSEKDTEVKKLLFMPYD